MSIARLRQVRFVIVGAGAAAVHFLVAVAAVSMAHLHPEAGNVAGYVVALVASYQGQSRWTFAQPAGGPVRFAKFAATSFAAFLLNATAYAALLRWTRLDYRVALVLVLGTVAALTFVSLRAWVFVRVPGETAP